jgi:hypothetical protein
MAAPIHFYVTSFISILHFISDDLIQCDASTTIAELFCEEFDDLDFELALCCFEATHKVAFEDRLWQNDPAEYEEMTLEDFMESYLNPIEQRDPLFITKRFLMFQDSLTKAFAEEGQEPPEYGVG